MAELYDPADAENFVTGIARELLSRMPANLPIEEPFSGPGVYALFYSGGFTAYSAIRGVDHPIYVGEATPKRTDDQPLYKRIKEHWSSIRQAPNLRVEDFTCRYLPLKPIWVKAVEELLLERFKPVWNEVVKGFGIHHPGFSGRGNQKRSMWDTLHPGRGFATTLPPNDLTTADILKRIQASFQIPPYAGPTAS